MLRLPFLMKTFALRNLKNGIIMKDFFREFRVNMEHSFLDDTEISNYSPAQH